MPSSIKGGRLDDFQFDCLVARIGVEAEEKAIEKAKAEASRRGRRK